MAVEVRVTAVLQRVVGEVLKNLEQNYPGFKSQVLSDDGELHRFVNIYKNDEDIRFLGQLGTAVDEGDVLSILPALAGGAPTYA